MKRGGLCWGCREGHSAVFNADIVLGGGDFVARSLHLCADCMVSCASLKSARGDAREGALMVSGNGDFSAANLAEFA